jgi:predicted CXXCH cytochrome family protein
MRKLRVSFSLLLMMVLVGMFSAVAFGATSAPTNVKVTIGYDNNMTVSWDSVAEASKYKVYLNGVEKVTTSDAATLTAVFSIVLDSKQTEQFNVEVSALDATDVESPKTLKILTGDNKDLLGSRVGTDTANDNLTNNNNLSGVGSGGQTDKFSSVIKSNGMKYNDKNKAAGTHKTHGEYQNNTNSCASCHQTHTASAENLLFKNGVYNTCTACHDGTLGFYNVFEASTAGTFGGTHEGNMSVHMANGSVAIQAAPGGNRMNADELSPWAGEFTCASCHAPHGSYSDRLLHYNPGGLFTAKNDIVIKEDLGLNSGEYAFKAITIVQADIDPGKYYAGTGLIVGDKILQAMKPTIDHGAITGYTPQPGFTLGKASASSMPKVIKSDSSTVTPEKVNALKGYIKIPTATVLADLKEVDNVTRANVVKLPLTEIKNINGLSITTSNNATLVGGTGDYKGQGIAMSEFCSACHTDYLAESGHTSGTYDTTSYRHSTKSDGFSCVRCHFGHGTDVTVMKDALGKDLTALTAAGGTYEGDAASAKAYLLDSSPSSALKRYTNMSVCWGCHTSSKSSTIINSKTYGDDGLDPAGLGNAYNNPVDNK